MTQYIYKYYNSITLTFLGYNYRNRAHGTCFLNVTFCSIFGNDFCVFRQQKHRFEEGNYIQYKMFFDKSTFVRTLPFVERTQTLQHGKPQLVLTISLLAPAPGA